MAKLSAKPSAELAAKASADLNAELIPCPLRNQRLQHPNEIALVLADGTDVSYQKLDHWVTQYCQQLAESGLTKGDRLAWIGPNTPELIVAILSSMRSGIAVIPINYRLPESVQQKMLKTISPIATWVDEQAKVERRSASKLSAQLAMPIQVPKLKTDVPMDSATTHPIMVNSKQPINMLFTSGSSGNPKAVVHCLTNHLTSANASQQNIPLKPGDRWLLSLPLFHIGGMAILYRCLNAGATLVLPDNEQGTQPSTDGLSQRGISHLSLVNTQLYRLLKAQPNKPTHLKYLLLGGSAIDDSLLEKAKAAGLHCFTSYGMTEMSSQICTGAAQGNNWVGQPLACTELQLSEQAELQVKGDNLALGYYTHPTIKPLTDDNGWFNTGDLAEYADGGYRITGRRDNRFVCGGENIQAEAIERCLLKHSEITHAVVVPAPDAEWGQVPVAFTNAVSGTIRTKLIETVKDQLGALAVPRQWCELTTPTGIKPNRAALQKIARTKIC
ncbi:o-succinylbenzoate--CoA ligase [Corallincola platygyrae]|uniref:O-succinylbenzoate--CoA ligase n=1 Tax=Corallincola platygyrae TaxID=1193278 RepID=A0ABW4XMJ4_9GAMM